MSQIFISWSGENGKAIALKLKEVIEEDIFNNKIKCFVSDSDIASGEDWWKKIQNELISAKLGIVCITKENTKAPWIYYESGALVGNNVKVIPLLFNCNKDVLYKTPLNGQHSVSFHDMKKFMKMISDINDELKLLDLSTKQLNNISLIAYKKMHNDLSDVFKKLKREGYFSEKYVYPSDVKTIYRKKVFVSAPMSILKEQDYQTQRAGLLKIVDVLKTIGFSQIVCPAAEIVDTKHFEGKTKAIQKNFRNLKQSDSFVLIYSKSKATSSLVELGYAIALCKKIVVFYRNEIPYLIEKAGENIPHIRLQKYRTYDDILKEFDSNKQALFSEKEDMDE